MNLIREFKREEVPEDVRDNESYAVFIEANRKIFWRYWRALLSFFVMGFCSYSGFIVVITGALDIIRAHQDGEFQGGVRNCTRDSTGVVLLTSVISSTAISLIIPFIPIFVHVKVVISIILAICGFLLISVIEKNFFVALLGVSFVSMSQVMSEATFLQYTAYFHPNVLSTWASGTGAAGIFCALAYTLISQESFKYTMLGMISMPVVMAITFWMILPFPSDLDIAGVAIQRNWNESEIRMPLAILWKKYEYLPKVLYKYMAPLSLMFFFMYFINQGIYELIKLPKHTLLGESGRMLYLWLQVGFQAGNFVGKTSIHCVYLKYIWAMALLEFAVLAVFITTNFWNYINCFWGLFVLAIVEGVLGGAAYANTFVRIGREEVEEEKQFMSAMTCFGNNFGMMLAGGLAILAHKLICKMDKIS